MPGPGAIHAVAGMANSSINCWPMLCIAGSSELSQDGLGAFQESWNPQGGAQMQIKYPEPACKYTAKIDNADRIPFFVEQAVRYAINGRPGASYLEIGGDTLREMVPAGTYFPPMTPDPPLQEAASSEVKKAMAVLKSAKSPLIIVGKGAAYAGATEELLKLVEDSGCPFLPTPMGKGCLPDDHELCIAPARSAALAGADVVLLVGARLNWILHFGRPPRYQRGVKFIQIDIEAAEIGHSIPAEVGLVGHATAVCRQLNEVADGWKVADNGAEWLAELAEGKAKNQERSAELANDRTVPMNYYCPLEIINQKCPRDTIIINEGSETMDIGRTVLQNHEPRTRLDAGSFGTMGVGLGQAIAACVVHPEKPVVLVIGDSAFGFSGMEFEAVCRYQMPLIVVIINNNGIGSFNPGEFEAGEGDMPGRLEHPSKSLTPQAHYEELATAFGGKGYFCVTPEELEAALDESMASRPYKPTIINTMISLTSLRKKQTAPSLDFKTDFSRL